jgi:hypothetical protein
MTKLLEQAIAELKKLPDTQQDEVAIMILEQIQSKDRLSSLWQKVDELGKDENKLTMAEITSMVKEVRYNQNRE